MLTPVYTTQFGKDLKRSTQRGKDTSKLKTIMVMLVNEKPLPPRCKDHKLRGNFKFRRVRR